MLTVIKQRFNGLIASVVRYPVTIVLLVAAAVLTAIDIASDSADLDLLKSILTCAVGAVACAAAQAAYERFFTGILWRVIMMALGIVVAALFYLSIMALPRNGAELFIRTAVMGFALYIAFVWIGVIRSRYDFSESFMAAFKALFQSAFFSGILFLGCIAIIAAIDRLITPINEDAYAHTANIVFVVVAPLMLLSLIPVYPGRTRLKAESGLDAPQEAMIKRRTGSPRFLEILLSYIVIPLASVFTVILLVYILLNIGGRFWTDNLLEPMLIAYTITVIVVTLLVANLDNKFAVLFRKIFPKALIPIALFQVIASVLIMSDTGVTYGRYFVILYGVFAVLSGVALSWLPIRKSGVIAMLLIFLSAVSLTPPVDAFTVSRNSQISTLESTLEKNGMLQGGIVTPDGSIPESDKTKIITTIQYLSENDNLDEVSWLPANFNGYDDTAFFSVFGFHMYTPGTPEYRYVSVFYNMAGIIPITGYDVMTQVALPYIDKPNQTNPYIFEVGGKDYSLMTEGTGGEAVIIIKDTDGAELSRFETKDIYARYAGFPPERSVLTLEEATFTVENDLTAVKIIVLNAGFTDRPGSTDHNAQMYVFVKIK